MVRVHDRPGPPGVLGKLTGDPAIKAAGVAISFGLDPLRYLSLGPDDADIVDAALVEASRYRNQREAALADRTGAQTSNGVNVAVRNLVKAMRPRR